MTSTSTSTNSSLGPLLSAADLGLADEVDRFAKAELGFLEAREAREPEALAKAARETLARIAGAGLTQHAVAPTDSGKPSLVKICVVRERLARAHGLADLMFAMQGLGTVPIALMGTAAQRERWLPPVARGETIAAFAMTEEEAGSDAAAMTTRAERDGDSDGWRLTGRKTFISNAGLAGLYVVFAKTDPESGRLGLSAFLVPGDAPGLRVERALEVCAPHPIGAIALEGVRVPAGGRLGDEGGGYRIAMDTLAFFRPSVGAAACGFAGRALDEAIRRAKARKQFGKPIAEFQLIQAYLAEMATDLDAARLLVYRAARLRDDGDPAADRAGAMAKLAATELAQTIVDKAVQIHGGTGVLVGSVVERLYREVRALRIYEGTSEIQKLIIAKDLLKE